MQRAMFIEFPEDPTTHHLDRQFMLGSGLLVAPVFVPEGEESEYYLPKGRWTSFFNPQRTLDGPTWVREVIPLNEIPVWVRPGTTLVLGPENMGRPDYDYTKDLDVRVYELEDGQTASAEVPTGYGTSIAGTVTFKRQEGIITVDTKGQIQLASACAYSGGERCRVVAEGK